MLWLLLRDSCDMPARWNIGRLFEGRLRLCIHRHGRLRKLLFLLELLLFLLFLLFLLWLFLGILVS